MKRTITIYFLAIAMSLVLTSSTAQAKKKVSLSAGKFQPEECEALKAYEGKSIFLASFYNYDGKTKRYAYFGKKTRYQTENIVEDYHWYCFKKALKYADVKVVEGIFSGGTAPELTVVFNRITDKFVEMKVTLYCSGDIFFEQEFKIQSDTTFSKNINVREQNAYKMMNKIICDIFSNERFKTAFFKCK